MTEELHQNPEFPKELPYRRVLDRGFVALVDLMGSDASIVQAARVSYGKGTKTVRSDKALISYLMRHKHTTPYEMIEFKFLMRLPVFIARQVIRHRTASVNEYSARHSLVPDRFWVPSLGAIAEQDNVNRQGRADLLRELADATPERTELHRVEELEQHGRIRFAHREVFPALLDRHVVLERDQHLRKSDLIGVIDQRLPPRIVAGWTQSQATGSGYWDCRQFEQTPKKSRRCDRTIPGIDGSILVFKSCNGSISRSLTVPHRSHTK